MPNQPKTPARAIRLTDEQVQAFQDAGKTLTQAVRETADAFMALTKTMGTFESPAHEAATLAAFPGLPECMSQDEARRRVARAVEAARPYIEREYAEKLNGICHKGIESTKDRNGQTVISVPWGVVVSGLAEALTDK